MATKPASYIPYDQMQQHGLVAPKGWAPPTAAPIAPAKPALGQGGAGEFAGNALRAIASPLIRTGAAIESGLDETVGRVANAARGQGFTPTQTGASAFNMADQIDADKDQTIAGQAGTLVGSVAPYFTPMGVEEGAANTATKAPGLLAKAGGYLAKAAPTIARDTALGTAQTGDIGQGLEIGATSGVLRGAGDLAKTRLAGSAVQKATDAINPDLTGKAKINAYKQVASGRGAQSSSMLHDQGLSPSDRTVAVATRLANGAKLSDGSAINGVKFGKDPVANLKTVGKSLNETEQSLQTALKGDPEMNFSLDKPTLNNKLTELKASKPMDFIGDNGKIYDNVVSYAQKIVDDTEDSISGGRDARTLFDQEAQRKFPTAFKGGTIDTSTPAGSAIKTVRDALNQHLYATAPNGSDIQTLIGREADLLNARDISAAKAASLHGFNWFQKFAKERPLLTKALGYGAVAVGGGEIAKKVGF